MMNWRASRHELKPTASWFEICDFMNWIALFLSCRRQFMHQRCNSWREPIHAPRAIHCTSVHPRDNKKHSAVAKCFLKFRPKVEIISWSFRNIVWYREYREYHLIKCCTKFAPRSHQQLTLFCSTNWNHITLSYFKLIFPQSFNYTFIEILSPSEFSI